MRNSLDREVQFECHGVINKEFEYYALFEYPMYSNDLSEDDKIVREFILSFKNPFEWERISEMVAISLLKKFSKEEIEKWTIAVIPASTTNKTTLRFEQFLKSLCRKVGVRNGYDIIKVKQDHKPLKGESVPTKIDFFEYRQSDLPENIFLFDDVFNTGQTFIESAVRLKKLGVKKIIGIMIGKTRRKAINKINKY